MFAKIHAQILDSSIADDYEKRDVFQDMLILSDRNGVVDMTYEAIAARTRRPIEMVKAKIAELMKPDPASRSYKANGARLVLLDPGQRTWGWRIVNHGHYRNLHNEEERSQFFRGRQRKRFVYYALCEDRVRIGLNSNPWAVITKLRVIWPGVQLAAKELGDETLLRRRHEDFARDFIGDGWFQLSRKLKEQIGIVAVNSRTPVRIAHDSTRLAKDSHKVAKDNQDSELSDKTFTGRIAKRIAKDSHRVAKDSQKTAGTEAEAEAYTEVPPTVPQGGQEGDLDFQSAKKFLNALFGREKRHWSREEEELLLEIVPIHAGEVSLIRAWFTASSFHPMFERTKRKQELTTFLRDFNGEMDKMRKFAPCFMDSVAGVEEEEPPRWQEFFKWKYNPGVRLPVSFRELDSGLRQEYADGFRCFVKEHPA